jgi:hypothetical protein
MSAGRVAIGREFSLAERTYGWLTADAVEVDEVDGYDVSKRRVLLDEVLLVTRHRARRGGVLLAWAAPALLFLSIASVSRAPVAIVLAVIAAPFVLGFALHMFLGTDYVTVFGRRSRARVAFNFRKGRAREVFDLVVREVEAAQGAGTAQPPPLPAAEAPAA